MKSTPVTAYVALGANLGDREKNIRRALKLLDATDGVDVVATSKLLDNPSQGGPDDAPPFLNAAAEVNTTLGAHALLHRLLEIEKEMGRTRRGRWEPRLIDLDLLLYDGQILSSQELIVPHPLMHERTFVLKPLAEIAGSAVHPVLGVTIAALLDALEAKDTGRQSRAR